MPDRKLVLVAGTGRSGTSTLVGVLVRHGFHVPQPEVSPDDTNPRGFGEPRWAVDLHGRLLRQSQVQVADSRPGAWAMARRPVDEQTRDEVRDWLAAHFEVSERLVVKDPRVLWFLPLWQQAADDLGVDTSFVTMLRPPPETVGSRREYYNRGLEDPHGIASWLNLMTGTEHATRGRPRTVVRYHDLLDGWEPALATVWSRNRLGEAPPTPTEDPGAFIDPGLRRMRTTWDDLSLPPRLAALAAEVSGCLEALADTRAGEEEDPALLARLDAARTGYADYYAECEAVAHSSVVAARQSGKPRTAPEPPRVRAPDGTGPGWPDPVEPTRVERLRERVPEGVRRRVPAGLRRGVRRVLDRG